MRTIFDFKVIFIAIFFLLTLAIKNSENFQLRDFDDGVSDTASKSVRGRPSTRVRFPFRKLRKADVSAEIEYDDDPEDDPEDDEDDSGEALSSYRFAKVRKPTFEVKKRTNLRHSKLDHFRKPSDDSDDDDEDDTSEKSFVSKFLDFFKRSPKPTTDDDQSEEDVNVSAEQDDDDTDETLAEKKPILSEIYDQFKDFLEERNKQQNTANDSESDEEKEDDKDASDGDTNDNDLENPSDNKLKISLKETFASIFNRKPFNWIFDFDSSDDEVKVFEDSEEDEILYQRLLKEEKFQEQKHTEQLIKQSSEEDAVKLLPVPEAEPEKVEVKAKAKAPETHKKKTKEEAHLAKKEFEKLILNLPSFVPDYSKVKNPECQRQGEVFQRQLRGQRIWALEMMDANAKIPSGLMRGNTNQLGDFDLCTKIAQKIKISETHSMKMKGKYCLANIDVVAAADQLKLPVHLIQGRNFIRSTINDPNHFFPRYSTINWGLCLPSACTYRDADQILESFIGPYNSTGIKLHINVNEDSCYVRQHVDVVNVVKSDWKILGTYVLLLIVSAATVLASLNDYLESPWLAALLTSNANNANAEQKSEGKTTEEVKIVANKNGLLIKVLSCFSVKRNISQLVKSNDNEIKCLHGLKAIAIVLLFASFKLITMGRVPYSNRNKLTEFFNSPFSVFLRSSFLYEDVFLVISGLLASLNLLKVAENGGKALWLKKILKRFFRLALPLAFVLLFYAYVWEHLGTGPQWSAVVDKNADLCKQNLWKNLLFIQNFYPAEEMCATHTYHLAVDFQLFILTPLLVWLIYKQPSYGLGVYGVLHALSAAARFSSTIESRLSVVVFHGMKLSQLYRTFNLSLAVALHRATPYLVGIALGIVIKEFGKVQLPKGAIVSGWISSLCAVIWCFYTPSNLSHKDYQYDPASAAQYSALAPLLWSLAVAWVIFASYSDASWKLNCILSSCAMIFISKISYSIYLIVFLVLFYFSGTVKSGEEFHLSSYIDRLEIFVVFTMAVLFTLAVDLPLQNIVKDFFQSESEAASTEAGQNKDDEEDFESPFSNEEDDFVYTSMKFKNDTHHADNHDSHLNGSHVNGNGVEEDEEQEQEETEKIGGEIPAKPLKVENNMNARRWKWEVLDD